jgi:hypothetical protein
LRLHGIRYYSRGRLQVLRLHGSDITVEAAFRYRGGAQVLQ